MQMSTIIFSDFFSCFSPIGELNELMIKIGKSLYLFEKKEDTGSLCNGLLPVGSVLLCFSHLVGRGTESK